MATYQNGLTGEVTLFIMEPEEEMAAIRFITEHKPSITLKRIDWLLTLTQQADQLKLRGGYGLNFQDIKIGGGRVD